MKLLRVFLIASLLAAGFAFLPGQPQASAADCISISGNGRTDYDPQVGPMALSAGTVLTATATRPSGIIFIWIYTDTETLYTDDVASPHSVTLEIAADANVTVFFGVYGDGDATYAVSTDGCASAGATYPEDMVQGTMVTDAPLYWAPGKPLTPPLTLAAGKNVYAGGLDDTGMYRQVLVVCDWLWVPVEAIGPNDEYPWNGTPLIDSFEIQSGSACASATGIPNVTWIPFGAA